MSKEWFILVYEEKEFLHNNVLRYKTFPNVAGIHDHCEICWDRFSNFKDDKHAGYHDPDSNCWICEECFIQFKDLYAWTIETTNENL